MKEFDLYSFVYRGVLSEEALSRHARVIVSARSNFWQSQPESRLGPDPGVFPPKASTELKPCTQIKSIHR